jgi:hypothetical protein
MKARPWWNSLQPAAPLGHAGGEKKHGGLLPTGTRKAMTSKLFAGTDSVTNNFSSKPATTNDLSGGNFFY